MQHLSLQIPEDDNGAIILIKETFKENFSA